MILPPATTAKPPYSVQRRQLIKGGSELLTTSQFPAGLQYLRIADLWTMPA